MNFKLDFWTFSFFFFDFLFRLSLEAYGAEEMFEVSKMKSGGSGVYDPDVPLVVDETKWQQSKQLFQRLRDVRDAQMYLPPIIQHVLGNPPSQSKW